MRLSNFINKARRGSRRYSLCGGAVLGPLGLESPKNLCVYVRVCVCVCMHHAVAACQQGPVCISRGAEEARSYLARASAARSHSLHAPSAEQGERGDV